MLVTLSKKNDYYTKISEIENEIILLKDLIS